MELILIRHTSVNIEKGTCYGQSDVSVSDLFDNEKDKLLGKLSFTDIKLISSPLSRCTKLAKHISKDFDIDDRIMELNFGDWEMQKWDDISDPRLNDWMNNYIDYRCPNGESLLDMKQRIEEFYNEIITQNFSKLIIVTHGGVIRLFYHLIQEIELDKILDLTINFGEVHSFKL